MSAVSVQLINSELVEGVLRTILVYDVVGVSLTLREIESRLLHTRAEEGEILHVLDFLCSYKILIKEDNHYQLYSRQGDDFKAFRPYDFSFYQKTMLSWIGQRFGLKGISMLERAGKKPLLIATFDGEVHSRRKEKVCMLISQWVGLKCFHSGIVPVKLRNPLTASLVSNLKPVVNAHALHGLWKRNSWVKKYTQDLDLEQEAIIPKNRDRNAAFVSGSLKSSGSSNFASYLSHVTEANNFEQIYSQRLLYASQWIMPQIRHAIKRNRIV